MMVFLFTCVQYSELFGNSEDEEALEPESSSEMGRNKIVK